jgi:hypothetical protein
MGVLERLSGQKLTRPGLLLVTGSSHEFTLNGLEVTALLDA